MDITITIPDGSAADLRDAFAWKYDYTRFKLENETKAQFAKRMLALHSKHILTDYKAHTASVDAIAASKAITDLIQIT
jgi:hypothetical protein